MIPDLPALSEAVTRALRAALAADPDDRGPYYRDAAERLVDARQAHFYTADGSPDWRGRSFAYRTFNGEAFGAANIPAADLPAVRAAVRYHIGNALRDRLSAEELQAAGMRAESPRERSVEQRAAVRADTAIVRGYAPIRDVEDVRRAADTIRRLLSRVDDDRTWALLPKDERDRLASLLSAMGQRLHHIP